MATADDEPAPLQRPVAAATDEPSSLARIAAPLLVGGVIGALAGFTLVSSWLPASLPEKWRAVLPVALGVVGVAFALLAMFSAPDRETLTVRRGGLDGTDVRMTLGSRATLFLAACFFCGMSAWMTQAPAPEAKGVVPPTTKEPSTGGIAAAGGKGG